MITSENIQQTQSFLGIKDAVQQRLILKKDSVKKIQYGVSLSTNVGLERWIEIAHPDQKIIGIVSEIHANQQTDKIFSDAKQFFEDSNVMIDVHRVYDAEKVVMNMQKVSYEK